MASELSRRALLLGAAPAILRAQSRRERPNILFAISDDQSWLHTGASGDRVVKTPTFDRVAASGVRFTHSFCCSPSCTPSRGGILTGQAIWRLEEGGNLWSTLDKKFKVYPDMLEQAGYQIGLQGKGWGPGRIEPGGHTRNPAGPNYRSFDEFLAGREKGKPFCFWYGSTDPHRPYEKGSGLKSGMRIEDVQVPPWLPDHPAMRSDILDYFFEIQRFDRNLGDIVAAIEKAGELENTLVIVTSDNGMPFPRAKTNLYDSGTRMPLAIAWPARVPGGRVIDDFAGHADFAPTILEACGLRPLPEMTGRSLLSILTSRRSGSAAPGRDRVFTARERHTSMRAGGVGYPMRAMRTAEYLYVRNYEPDRWPSGDPPDYGDIDNSPAKEFVIEHRATPKFAQYFEVSCAKRPAEELYDLKKDPGQLTNVAAASEYRAAKQKISGELTKHLRETKDPRETGGPVKFDEYPYYGRANPQRRQTK